MADLIKAKKILIIDDDEDIRFSVTLILEEVGYNVEGAENGLKALDLLENRESPNLILLDMKMPVMDGWQFSAEFIKKYDRRIPVVVMTAAADAAKRAQEANATAWIGKPFSTEKLLTLIKELCNSPEAP